MYRTTESTWHLDNTAISGLESSEHGNYIRFILKRHETKKISVQLPQLHIFPMLEAWLALPLQWVIYPTSTQVPPGFATVYQARKHDKLTP